MSPGHVYRTPGFGTVEIANTGEEGVESFGTPAEKGVGLPRARKIPGGGETESNKWVCVTRDYARIAGGIVLGNKVIVGKLSAQGFDDVLKGVSLDTLSGIKTKAIDSVVPKVQAGVIEEKLSNFGLPESETFAPRRVMTVYEVNTAFNAFLFAVDLNGVACVVSVVSPVAVFAGAGVGIDDIKEYGYALGVRRRSVE